MSEEEPPYTPSNKKQNFVTEDDYSLKIIHNQEHNTFIHLPKPTKDFCIKNLKRVLKGVGFKALIYAAFVGIGLDGVKTFLKSPLTLMQPSWDFVIYILLVVVPGLLIKGILKDERINAERINDVIHALEHSSNNNLFGEKHEP